MKNLERTIIALTMEFTAVLNSSRPERIQRPPQKDAEIGAIRNFSSSTTQWNRGRRVPLGRLVAD